MTSLNLSLPISYSISVRVMSDLLQISLNPASFAASATLLSSRYFLTDLPSTTLNPSHCFSYSTGTVHVLTFSRLGWKIVMDTSLIS